MGEDKRKKMHGKEVNLIDVILENRKLKTKIINLEERYKKIETRVTNLENAPPPLELGRIGGG